MCFSLWHTHSATHYSICLPHCVTCWAPSYIMALCWELSMGSNFHLLPHRAPPHMELSHQWESALLWKTGPRWALSQKDSPLIKSHLREVDEVIDRLFTLPPPPLPAVDFILQMRTSGLALRASGWTLGCLSSLLLLATNDVCGMRKLPSISSCVKWRLRTWWLKTSTRIIIPLFIPDICIPLWLQGNNHSLMYITAQL